MDEKKYSETLNAVITECKDALDLIDTTDLTEYLNTITQGRKIFFVGVGRVMLSLQCIAKRYAHLGIDAYIVGQITEPAITSEDVLVVASGSGETLFPVAIAKKAKHFGAKVVHIGSNPESSLTPIADVFVRIPVASKMELPDEIKSIQPMTSLFEQSLLLFGDITAKILIDEKEIDMKSLWNFHANLE